MKLYMMGGGKVMLTKKRTVAKGGYVPLLLSPFHGAGTTTETPIRKLDMQRTKALLNSLSASKKTKFISI